MVFRRNYERPLTRTPLSGKCIMLFWEKVIIYGFLQTWLWTNTSPNKKDYLHWYFLDLKCPPPPLPPFGVVLKIYPFWQNTGIPIVVRGSKIYLSFFQRPELSQFKNFHQTFTDRMRIVHIKYFWHLEIISWIDPDSRQHYYPNMRFMRKKTFRWTIPLSKERARNKLLKENLFKRCTSAFPAVSVSSLSRKKKGFLSLFSYHNCLFPSL